MTCYCKLIRYAELILRRNCPGFEPDTSGRTVTHLARACICRLPSSASLRPKMSAPELPEELAGHLAVLKDKSDAYAKARAATAIASGKAHLAALVAYPAPALRYCLLGGHSVTPSPQWVHVSAPEPQAWASRGARRRQLTPPGARRERRRRAIVGPHEVQCTV